ncbi:MAG: hypothetical protein OJF51_004096 [Nitrospira sp.]|jgi:hypothetical protein|nr:MAG: hypothetical protein OJF51_004096 [Nitrospira sp.]
MFGVKKAVVLLIPRDRRIHYVDPRAGGSSHFNGGTERTGTNMMSDEIAMLTISGAIFFAVLMLAMFMRKA